MMVHGNKDASIRSRDGFKYGIIGFARACQFSERSDPATRLVQPFASPRRQRAPEMDGDSPYDPFAADVYQLARTFYAWFAVCNVLLILDCSLNSFS